MKKIIQLFIFLLFTAQLTHSQIMYEKHYGGSEDDGGNCVMQTDDWNARGGIVCRNLENYFVTLVSEI